MYSKGEQSGEGDQGRTREKAEQEPFRCDTCGATFRDADALAKHMQIHAAAKEEVPESEPAQEWGAIPEPENVPPTPQPSPQPQQPHPPMAESRVQWEEIEAKAGIRGGAQNPAS